MLEPSGRGGGDPCSLPPSLPPGGLGHRCELHQRGFSPSPAVARHLLPPVPRTRWAALLCEVGDFTMLVDCFLVDNGGGREPLEGARSDGRDDRRRTDRGRRVGGSARIWDGGLPPAASSYSAAVSSNTDGMPERTRSQSCEAKTKCLGAAATVPTTSSSSSFRASICGSSWMASVRVLEVGAEMLEGHEQRCSTPPVWRLGEGDQPVASTPDSLPAIGRREFHPRLLRPPMLPAVRAAGVTGTAMDGRSCPSFWVPLPVALAELRYSGTLESHGFAGNSICALDDEHPSLNHHDSGIKVSVALIVLKKSIKECNGQGNSFAHEDATSTQQALQAYASVGFACASELIRNAKDSKEPVQKQPKVPWSCSSYFVTDS